MTRDSLTQVFKELGNNQGHASVGADAELPRKLAAVLPWGALLFFYLPLIYWFGLALHATLMLDYPGYYLAAHMTFIDRTTPYGFDAFDQYAYAYGRWMPPYVYPPPSILAFWPLTFFSIQNAFIIFSLVSHLCLLGSVWLMVVRLTPQPRQTFVRTVFLCAAIIYILSSDAVHVTLELGQVNLIVLFLICLALVALKEQAPAWRIAAPLSLAILLKTYPLFLVLLLVTRRRFKAAALTVAYFAAMVALAALVIPRVVWTSWMAEVMPAASNTKYMILLFSHTPMNFMWNQSITGFVKRLFGDTIWGRPPLSLPWLAAPLITALNIAVIGITSFVVYRFHRKRAPVDRVTDDIAAFLLMMYLVSPVSWNHHLVFVFPAGILTLALLLNGTVRGKAAVGLAAILCVFVWRFQMDASLFRKSWWMLLGFAQFYAVAALWVFFTLRLARGSSRTPEDSTIPVLSHSLQPQL